MHSDSVTSSSLFAVRVVGGMTEQCVKGVFDSVWLLHILLLTIVISFLCVCVNFLLVCACEKLGCKTGERL